MKNSNTLEVYTPKTSDFEEFGKRIGVSEKRIEKLMNPFLEKKHL